MTVTTEPRRVLLATCSVQSSTGTDLYTRDLALALLRRGWLPIVYAPLIGRIGEELRRATIPVVGNLDDMSAAPDVIVGHHTLETIAALLRFPGVPAAFVCHGAEGWSVIPPDTPRIGAYVAVDRNCRDRMVFEHRIAADSIRILANAVDLQRFPRRPPLPDRPRRALIFSNQAAENTFAAPIREACAARGIELDLIGTASGKPAVAPERVLPDYDLVFAKARCALEALAVGAAVIACDARGLAGMITSESLDAMRELNFGARTLQRPITAETAGAEIDRYDAADATRVADRIRAMADLDLLAEQYLALFDELLAKPVIDDTQQLAASLGRITRSLYQQSTVSLGPMRKMLLNSRTLGAPVQWMWRLRQRWRKRL